MNLTSFLGWRGAVISLFLLIPALRASAQIVPHLTGAVSAAAAATPPAAADVDEEEFEDEYATATTRVSDPFERVNRTVFKFNTSLSKHVLRPVSRGYETVVPAVARRGISSFYRNLRFPVRFVSCVLQGKVDRAAAETGKFALNSTVGLAGFINVADRYPALRVPEEDIGQAFGAMGFSAGPFLVLPVLGPSSVRDGLGRVGDYYLMPLNWEFVERYDDWVQVTLQAGDILNTLPDVLRLQDNLQRAALDPYIAFRNAFLQYREGEVKK